MGGAFFFALLPSSERRRIRGEEKTLKFHWEQYRSRGPSAKLRAPVLPAYLPPAKREGGSKKIAGKEWRESGQGPKLDDQGRETQTADRPVFLNPENSGLKGRRKGLVIR